MTRSITDGRAQGLLMTDTRQESTKPRPPVDVECALQRIQGRITVDRESGCWLYQGAATADGYGLVTICNQNEYTHRLMASAHLGLDRSSGMHVLHRCDVRLCCN